MSDSVVAVLRLPWCGELRAECCFLSCVHGLALAAVCAGSSTSPDLPAAVRATIMVGGDQASRSLFIGAALAAAGARLPLSWRARATSAHQPRDDGALSSMALAEELLGQDDKDLKEGRSSNGVLYDFRF